jgi:hypothetical protein
MFLAAPMAVMAFSGAARRSLSPPVMNGQNAVTASREFYLQTLTPKAERDFSWQLQC